MPSRDPSSIPDVVVVGAAARDVDAADPRGWRLGGGATYGALTAARLGLRTAALVGVDAAAASAVELEQLRQAGVDLVLVPLASGPVFENIERPAGRLQIAHAQADPMTQEVVPDPFRAAPGWLLVPVAGELGDEWATSPSQEAIVGLGWQGLVRGIRPGEAVVRRPPAPSALVERADLLGIAQDDLAPDTAVASLCRLARRGATVLVTAGDRGGMAFEVEHDGKSRGVRFPALRSDAVVDPTGAGDVMLAAVLAARVRPDLVGGRLGQRLDMLLGAAAASLVVEGTGLAAVPTRAAVRRRLGEAMVRRTDR